MADSSLEDDLLLAVGHTSGYRKDAKHASRKPRAPMRASDTSGDDSDGDDESEYQSQDEDEEDGEFEARKMNQAPSKKGSAGVKGSKMPLKKRFEADRDDGENEEDDVAGRGQGTGEGGGGGDESDALSFGSDLYYDSEDRAKLSKMKEFEREMELFSRSERKDAFVTRKREKEERRKQKAAAPPTHLKSGGGNRGGAKPALSQKEAQKVEKQQRQEELKNMVAQKKKDKEAGGGRVRKNDISPSRRGSASTDSDSETGPESGSDEELAGGRRRGRGRGRGVGAGVDSDDDVRGKPKPDADLADFRKIVVRRAKLAQWCYEPVFEEVVVGCLVRISIGPNMMGVQTYRVCTVIRVETDGKKTYLLDNKRTSKHLHLKWGSSTKTWPMNMVSDKPPTEVELREMCTEMDRSNIPRLSLEYVTSKEKSIVTSFQTIVYTEETVKKILAEKRAAQAIPLHWIVERDRLEKEAAKAQKRGEEAEYERLLVKMTEVEQRGKAASVVTDERTKSLTRMNARNKNQNYRAASASVSNADLKAGDEGHDPFVRRWTRSQNYYRLPSTQKASDSAGQEGDVAKDVKAALLEKAAENGGPKSDVAKESTNGVAAKAKEAISARKAGLEGGVGNMERYTFKMDISLEPLKRWGPPQEAFMSRKRVLEATCGAPTSVPNASKKSGNIYSMNDYKRRLGLL